MKKSLNALAFTLLASISNYSSGAITLRPEIAQPLQLAQEHIAAKRFAQALEAAQKVQALKSLTPTERTIVQQLVSISAIETKNYVTAIEAVSYLTTASDLSREARLQYFETLIDLLRATKDVNGIIRVARQYFDEGGGKLSIREVYVQALSIRGNHEEVIRHLDPQATTGGATASEPELRSLAFAYKAVKNEDRYYATLKLLTKKYPNKDYWFDLLTRIQKQTFFNQRFELDVYRMMNHLKLLDEAEDFFYYAQLALRAGFPEEARYVLEDGKTARVFNTPSTEENFKKLNKLIIGKQTEDERQSKLLKNTPQPQSEVDLAEITFSRRKYQEAADKYSAALAGRTFRREGEYRLHQMIALIMIGQKDKTTEIRQHLRSEKTADELGELWLMVK